jgi:alkanesulfonate monooxygenase SsuD/methylene tetrahydromethanopterin reductase-like flavin-dependent oxidoreductase (luciferase family)
MEICIQTEPSQAGASYATLLRFARAAEDLGFHGFFRSDHLLQFGQPARPAGPSDAWTSLAGLARETSRIRLGTLVSPVTFRSPGQLAIQVAQVDEMSGGRAELGLGSGWFKAEHDAYAIGFPARRSARLAEALDIITGLWQTPPGETFTFAGEHYSAAGAQPASAFCQKPGPPIVLGGIGGPRTIALAARHAAEYNVPFAPVEGAAKIWAAAAAATAGEQRAYPALRFSVMQTAACGKSDEDVRARTEAGGEPLRPESFQGSPQQLVEQISRYAEAGADRVYLRLLDLEDLDHLELISSQVLPHL